MLADVPDSLPDLREDRSLCRDLHHNSAHEVRCLRLSGHQGQHRGIWLFAASNLRGVAWDDDGRHFNDVGIYRK